MTRTLHIVRSPFPIGDASLVGEVVSPNSALREHRDRAGPVRAGGCPGLLDRGTGRGEGRDLAGRTAARWQAVPVRDPLHERHLPHRASVAGDSRPARVGPPLDPSARTVGLTPAQRAGYGGLAAEYNQACEEHARSWPDSRSASAAKAAMAPVPRRRVGSTPKELEERRVADASRATPATSSPRGCRPSRRTGCPRPGRPTAARQSPTWPGAGVERVEGALRGAPPSCSIQQPLGVGGEALVEPDVLPALQAHAVAEPLVRQLVRDRAASADVEEAGVDGRVWVSRANPTSRRRRRSPPDEVERVAGRSSSRGRR